MTRLLSLALAAVLALPAAAAPKARPPFRWENAAVYFLLTDRFFNGDPKNDLAYGRKADAAPLRGFMGGDLKGVTAKIKAGYFDDLGVTALWLTPPVEQIHGSTDEGTGKTYGFHGYWAKDWTRVDANLGTEDDLRALVDAAHARGIRVLLDVVLNHTGPVTADDPVWPDAWVRTSPQCTYKDAPTTITCTLVKNLPDIRTESDGPAELPPALAAKWKAEGRYEREVAELDAFFKRTGFPRAPRYYLMKWHTDWVRKLGVDGFRADTAKHVEPGVWKDLKALANEALADWKRRNPKKKLDDAPFFMTGEVWGWSPQAGRAYDMGGGTKTDFFANGLDSLINFGFKTDAAASPEELFARYSAALHGPLAGAGVLNFASSHDEQGPFDAARRKPFETAEKLLLAPGAAQIYYGDETARLLSAPGAQGDANLRSFMNWDELAKDAPRDGYGVAQVRRHWGLLGRFRRAHVAVGAGLHEKLQDAPYAFARRYDADGVRDAVVVALGVPPAGAEIDVRRVFPDGTRLLDEYSGESAVVRDGKARVSGRAPVALLGSAH